MSGDLTSDKISDESKALIADAVEKTKDLKEGTINICFNYGSKSEIIHAANAAINSGQPITEQTISENLWTKGLPDVDLLIRPGGELRLSNFLLWQAAYAELYFIDCLWPDFTNEELDKALQWYEGRNRRFGNV